MLESINKRFAEAREKTSAVLAYIERAKLFAKARSGKIVALKVPDEVRGQVEAIRQKHGLSHYTETVHFVFAMGLFALKEDE